MAEQLYTASRLRVFRECARKHLYKYALRIITPSTPVMEFGTHAHGALEAWYLAWKAGVDRLAAAIAYINAIESIDEIDRIRLRVLICAYHARWNAEDWEVLAVEVEFDYWLGDVHIGGKIDALIRERATGKAYIVEHKTSTADTTPGSPYWARLSIDTQVSIYTDGAAFGLDVEIAGCIYDVLKRPQHEPKLATPEESRRYTIGKGCSKCGGSAKAGEVKQGRGFYESKFGEDDVRRIDCDGCAATGWKLDKDGKPQAPHLDARQRDTDETLDEFEERLANEIAERVDDFLSRGIVVRLDTELPRMRQELLDTIALMQRAEEYGLAPPNHDSCIRGRNECAFFNACVGRSDINNEYAWPRSEHAHPELSASHSANAA